MAHANANVSVSLPQSYHTALFAGARAKLSNLALRLANKKRRRRTLEQLAFVDDRLLEDIGMPRATVALELGYDPRLVRSMAGISVPR